MKKLFLILTAVILNFNLSAQEAVPTDSVAFETIDIDSLLNSIVTDTVTLIPRKPEYRSPEMTVFQIYQLLENAEPATLDSGFLQANPLFMPLVYREKQNDFTTGNYLKYNLNLGKKPSTLESEIIRNKINIPSPEQIVYDLRNNIYKHFILHNPTVFAYKQKHLPNPAIIRNRTITVDNWDSIRVHVSRREHRQARIDVPQIIVGPWTKKANAMLQFSHNMVSKNWYKGGNSTLSGLGVLSGQMNYDNKKNIQFENNLEWRLGLYYVDDTAAVRKTGRYINVNEDVFKINSKIGLKMAGNWFYSTAVDFSTQAVNNHKSISDTTLKARFLTPARLNVGVGVDYKYKKLFSLVISPLAWKYVYANDTVRVDRKQFGIEPGKNYLSDIGSSFTAQLNYQPVKEIQIDSKLKFFTNYEKFEIDWEIVCNFTINRYLSTRLSINPRYDNTPILTNPNEKVKIQFKELLSFGFSYKLLN